MSYLGRNGTVYPASTTAPTNAGDYTASATFGGDDNHTGSNDSKNFTIDKATLTVTETSKTIIQGGSVLPLTCTATGQKNNEVITASCAAPTNGLTVGSFPMTATLTDPAGKLPNYSISTVDGTVNVTANAKPVITALTAPIAPQQLTGTGANITADITFTDADPAESTPYTIVIDWGDGKPTQTVTSTAVTNTTTLHPTHQYTETGVYRITVTLSDKIYPNADTEIFEYVVVFDPSGGFVTGGGWINSPATACQLTEACNTLTGKANFGLVSKYQKGANVPTGDTEFQFQTGGLNFKSKVYEWLVVAGARAQFKGTGTVNGSGNYGFILTAIDGTSMAVAV